MTTAPKSKAGDYAVTIVLSLAFNWRFSRAALLR